MTRLNDRDEWELYLREHKWWWKWPLIVVTLGVWVGAMVLFVAPWQSNASIDDLRTNPATSLDGSDENASDSVDRQNRALALVNEEPNGGQTATSISGDLGPADALPTVTPEATTATASSTDVEADVTSSTVESRRRPRTTAPPVIGPVFASSNPVFAPSSPFGTTTVRPTAPTTTVRPTAPTTTVRPTAPTTTVRPTAPTTTVRPTTTYHYVPTTTDPPPATTDPPPATTDPPPATTDPPPATTDPPPATTDPPPATTDPPPATTDPPPATTDPPPSEPFVPEP